jgi:hypothetical protein
LALLAHLANIKPHIYFLAWKKMTIDDIIDYHEGKAMKHKRRAKVAAGTSHL